MSLIVKNNDTLEGMMSIYFLKGLLVYLPFNYGHQLKPIRNHSVLLLHFLPLNNVIIAKPIRRYSPSSVVHFDKLSKNVNINFVINAGIARYSINLMFSANWFYEVSLLISLFLSRNPDL